MSAALTQEQLVNVIFEFVSNTISGHESGFYKASHMQLQTFPITKEQLKSKDIMTNLIMLASANYLNGAYRALIKKNDQYYQQYFDRMSSIMNHSKICLLNIVFYILTNSHLMFDRSSLDITNYDNYMKSVKNEIKRIEGQMKGPLIMSISHECKGEDISKCNPEEPMFVIRTK